MWLGDLVLDPISGAIVSNQLRRIEDELFAAEWKEAKERLGEGATITGADLARTPTQRRADALVEMATRAGVAPENGRRPEPLFSVFVGYETFAGRMCQIADGAVVSPGTLWTGWTGPGSSGWCSTGRRGSWTWGRPPGCSVARTRARLAFAFLLAMDRRKR